jgi:hypothetical protein
MIKLILGIILIITGVILGCFVGIWIMFVGGILAIARAIDAHTLTATITAINIIKICLSAFVGGIIGYGIAAVGLLIISN